MRFFNRDQQKQLRIIALGSAALLGLAACGGGSSESPGNTDGGDPGNEQLSGTVTILGTWSGAEQDSFLEMVAPWEEQTGVTVEYTGSRDLPQQIAAGITSGNLPDVASLPGPGFIADWADQGALKSLDFVDAANYQDATPAGFAELGEVDGELYGVFIKAAVKGLNYYNTSVWDGTEPATWDELTAALEAQSSAADAAWCVGFESGAASGWPGTDWIEDILLRQAGPEVYDQLFSGELSWTDQAVKDAFATFGEVLDNTHGGSTYVVNTNFGRGGNPLFDDPPGCLLHHQASFITDFFANEAGATPDQYDFFPFPAIDTSLPAAVTGGGDLMGMFNDTPEARSLIQYLLTPEAQSIWAERGGFISANKNVSVDVYPDEATRQAAQILQDAEVFRFDGSDLLPASVNDAFMAGMVQFSQDQSQLDSILSNLDQVTADSAN